MQLPFKITHGAVFRTAVVDAINGIIDYLHASRVKGDNRTIKVQETAGGVIISAIPQSIPKASSTRPATADYNGYFKVVDVPTSDGSPATQIKIIDGANPEASVCGMSDVLASVQVATITKTSGTIVYAIASYSSSVFTVTFQCSGTTPTGSVGYIPIASISGTGVIRQLWVSNRLVFRAEFLI